MKILVVAATKNEVQLTIDHFSCYGDHFMETEKFDILITGVGMVATAFALGQHLSSKYGVVLNVGIAGSFDRTISLGELVNITEDTFAELGAEDHEDFISLQQLGFGEHTFYAVQNDLPTLKKVKGITVNKVHGKASSIAKIVELCQPQTESMEGAAVFFACHRMSISVLQVRSISNYVEPRNKASWDIGLAVKNLNYWLINYLTELYVW
jgi:futalosine hydrolase